MSSRIYSRKRVEDQARWYFCIWLQRSSGNRIGGRGLNEIGHSFLCSKSPARLPAWRTRSGDSVKVQDKIKYKRRDEGPWIENAA